MIAATVCKIARGRAPASAPAKAVNGTKAIEHSPLEMHRSMNRLTSIGGN